MKKTLSIILSIVLVISCISLLAGCGEKGETAEKTLSFETGKMNTGWTGKWRGCSPKRKEWVSKEPT